MEQEDINRLRELHEAATPGPWDIWREPIKDIQDAIDEAMVQVQATDPIVDAMVMLNASGKCPAMTGCGPTSDANAALIATMRNALPTLIAQAERVKVLEEALKEQVGECFDPLCEMCARHEAILEQTGASHG